jgi:hypothetical protein
MKESSNRDLAQRVGTVPEHDFRQRMTEVLFSSAQTNQNRFVTSQCLSLFDNKCLARRKEPFSENESRFRHTFLL